jgi:uncharacterized protein with GYD domain
MINNPDDRVVMARQVCEALGGTLESCYWLPLAPYDVVMIFDGPDAVTVAGAVIAVTSTGAVQHIQTHEMLTQEQLSHALTVAADVKKVWRPPGQHE